MMLRAQTIAFILMAILQVIQMSKKRNSGDRTSKLYAGLMPFTSFN